MYKDFQKYLKGKLHIIIICLRSRKIRQLSKLGKIILIRNKETTNGLNEI